MSFTALALRLLRALTRALDHVQSRENFMCDELRSMMIEDAWLSEPTPYSFDQTTVCRSPITPVERGVGVAEKKDFVRAKRSARVPTGKRRARAVVSSTLVRGAVDCERTL